MRIIAFILGLVALGSSLFAQREDFTWLLGFSDIPTIDSTFGRIIATFSDTGILLLKQYNVKFKLDYTNASICDSNGRINIYSNGLEIYDSDHNIMPNGDGINPGWIATNTERIGYTIIGGMMILQSPEDDSVYMCFHNTLDRTLFIDTSTGIASSHWYALGLLSSKVNMKLNQSKGDVVYKNKQVFSDTICGGTLSACRHANGRDWWINVLRYDGLKMFTLLYDMDGIHRYRVTAMPAEIHRSNLGLAVYNPQGNKIAYFMINDNYTRQFLLCDFDRCTGEISNPQYGLDSLIDDFGIMFSASGRFLYLGTGTSLYQMDMLDKEPFVSKTLIDTIDRFRSGRFGYATLGIMARAPNGKIYICAGRNSKHLGVIEYPDRKGKECKLVQHKIDLGIQNGSLPNLVDHHMGKVTGSLCDTLDIIIGNKEFGNGNIQMEIFPNPANAYLEIEINTSLPPDQLVFTLYNLVGKEVDQKVITHCPSRYRWDTHNLESGMYVMQVIQNNKLIKSTKLILAR